VTHLRQAMLEELHRRNYAASTITYYIQHVEQFARFSTVRCQSIGEAYVAVFELMKS
jgi:hypothetical protein